ncbi:type I-E CRISPR-associated endoribonuclease Cas2 [Bifidobacterium sp. SO1]|nr:type I-E CRISPR-associated endoribonuclease Cas2 [Bifidobacterium sp. SO1]
MLSVGNVSAKVRERLWRRIGRTIHDGRATMAWYTQSQLHILDHHGKRTPIQLDGTTLMSKPLGKEDNPTSQEVSNLQKQPHDGHEKLEN